MLTKKQETFLSGRQFGKTTQHKISEYESVLGIIFKMQGKGSIVAGDISNKHNPGYLSQLIKEQEDEKLQNTNHNPTYCPS